MAKFCFDSGIVSGGFLMSQHKTLATYLALLTCSAQQLKRIEVIEDDEGEIVEAVRRMSEKYDFVVTR